MTWQTVVDPFDGDGSQIVSGLMTNSFGELIAWGSDTVQRDLQVDSMPTFWATSDLLNWRESRLGAFGDNLELYDVAQGPGGFSAVGTAREFAAAWASPDGFVWQPAVPGLQIDIREAAPGAIAGADSGYLAVGADEGRAAAWFSPDAHSWTRIDEVFPQGSFAAVSQAHDGGYVVVGERRKGLDTDAAIWLVSADGTSWEPSLTNEALAGPREEAMTQVWAYGRGYLALGYEFELSEAGCGPCVEDPATTRLYTSPDGREWVRHSLDLDSAGPTLTDFTAVAASGDDLIAVGYGTDRILRVWTCANGVDWLPAEGRVSLGLSGNPSVHDLLVVEESLVIAGFLASDDGYVAVAAPQ